MVRARVARLKSDSQDFASFWFRRAFQAQSLEFYLLLGVTIFIVFFGLIMVLSSSAVDSLRANNDAYSVFLHQAIFAMAGLVIMVVASLLPSAFYSHFALAVFGVGLVSQFLIQVTSLGVSVNGNRAWLNIMGFQFQPSEFIKLGLILVLARIMSMRERNVHDFEVFSKPVFLLGLVSVGLILWGSDMGTALIVVAIVVCLVLFSGAPIEHFKWPAVFVAVGVIGLVVTGSSRLGRILAWSTSPTDDMASAYAWQSVHGVWAVAAGGLTGVGLGGSKMKWSWIPEVENDYIFAVICEELGMIGALTLIALFVFMAVLLYRIYSRSESGFSRYLVLGVMAWILIQATVNIAVVLQLLPVFGVPLPLISAGGSSLISGMGAIGMVLAIERENVAQQGLNRQRPNSNSLKSSRSARPTQSAGRR